MKDKVMPNTSTKIRRLAEVEMLRAEIKARRVARRALIISAGVIAGGIAIVFLSYGSFLWLAERYGAINAAMSIGGALLAIAASAIAYSLVGPGRREELESEILNRAIEEARDDLRVDIEALETSFNKVSSGLAKFIDGRKENEPASGNVNLAMIAMVLSAIGAVSPTLNRYIQPILKIIS